MKRHIIYAAGALLVLTLGGCDALPFLAKKDKEVATQATLPTDRTAIGEKTEKKPYSSRELDEGAVMGDWSIETVNGRDVVGNTPAFLKFVPGEKRVYGNNGCNVLNGTYRFNEKDSTVRFADLVTTMRLCPEEGITDQAINTALAAADHYSWKHVDNDYYMTFYDIHGTEVMTLLHQSFAFLNGTWRVAQIEDQTMTDPGMRVVIDVDEGKIHGNTGCNVLNGDLEVDLDTANAISFSGIATTRMMCPHPELQTAMIVALEDASRARPVDSNTVYLLDALGNRVMTLVRE